MCERDPPWAPCTPLVSPDWSPLLWASGAPPGLPHLPVHRAAVGGRPYLPVRIFINCLKLAALTFKSLTGLMQTGEEPGSLLSRGCLNAFPSTRQLGSPRRFSRCGRRPATPQMDGHSPPQGAYNLGAFDVTVGSSQLPARR